MAFDSVPSDPVTAAPPRAVSHRLQPLRAARALRRLIADKEDTSQVFEIMRALSGDTVVRGYSRLISTAHGGRIELVSRVGAGTTAVTLAGGGVAGAGFAAGGSDIDSAGRGCRAGAVLSACASHPITPPTAETSSSVVIASSRPLREERLLSVSG